MAKMREKSFVIFVVFLISVKCAFSSNSSEINTEAVIHPVNDTISLNETSADSLSSRNSRQLWSFVKKVIKTSIDQHATSSNPNPVSGGLLTSLFGSGVPSSVVNSGVPTTTTAGSFNQNPHFANPNDYMHYLLLNSQNQQHASLPHYHYQQQQQMEASTSDLINKYQEQMTSSSNVENVESASTTGSQILSKLALGSILDDFDIENMANFLSFGTFERMVGKVSKFDKLKCIPRLLCQMVAKRAEDAKTTTTTTTSRPKKVKRKSDPDQSAEDNDGEESSESSDEDRVVIKPAGSNRSAKFLNVQGGDTALEQVVKFLELMQLKDWALYPYLHGAYQGSQVVRTEECASRFSSCPFSDDQLVYYFNNYNGGFFQSI